MIEQQMQHWHEIVRNRDANGLKSFLDAEVIFHSPVLFEPQRGIELTTFYLSAALKVLVNDHFKYEREIRDGANVVLEFTTELDGIVVNGVDMIRFNESGRVIEFKVMLRPLKGIQAVQERMMKMLQAMKNG